MVYARSRKPVTKNKSTYKRRAPVRRKRPVHRRSRGTRGGYNVAPSGMPRVRVAHLRYVQLCNFETIDTVLGNISFNANSAFDPAGLASKFVHIDSHQPMGFDQWALLFRNYVVKGSKITVTRIGCQAETTPQPDQTESGRFGIYVSDTDAPVYTRGTSYKEARKGQVRYVSNNQRSAQKCTAYYSPRRMYGIKDIKDNQDRLGAVVGANPTELAKFVLWAELENVPQVETTWNFEISMEYCIQFDEPVDLLQSTA